MSLDVLYLQTLYSKNQNPLKGARLFERLQRDAKACRLAYFVGTDGAGVAPAFERDLVTCDELDALKPDVVFVEGGIANTGGDLRIPRDVLEREVARGAVVVLMDIDWNELNQHRDAYQPVLDLCRVSVAFDGNEPVSLIDRHRNFLSDRSIVCDPANIAFAEWLAPVYDELAPFVVGNPVPMTAWSELVSTCNRDTTEAKRWIGQLEHGDPNSGAFAAAHRIGMGYVVLITGRVSSDILTREFPSNVEWLTRLARHLVERVRIDRRRGTTSYFLFLSHRHRDREFTTAFRDELVRRGFGTWLDSRELAAGDDLTPEIGRAVEQSTHLVLMWSAACVGAEWIERELGFATAGGKRILLVRLDDTPVPAAVADKLRVEAQELSPEEAARLISVSLEREERRD